MSGGVTWTHRLPDHRWDKNWFKRRGRRRCLACLWISYAPIAPRGPCLGAPGRVEDNP